MYQSFPLDTGHNAQAWAKNCRVEIVYQRESSMNKKIARRKSLSIGCQAS